MSTRDDNVRLMLSTNEDRIETFKRILDLYPGPFFLTVIVQNPHGALRRAGRMYSNKGKSRIQIDFFLDHFNNFISFAGMIHLWVTCETSSGIVVYDQHDYFFIYERSKEAIETFAARGYRQGPVDRSFAHAHSERIDIVPGTKELLEYGTWWWQPLELTDVAEPHKKTIRNLILRFRSRRLKKLRRKWEKY